MSLEQQLIPYLDNLSQDEQNNLIKNLAIIGLDFLKQLNL